MLIDAAVSVKIPNYAPPEKRGVSLPIPRTQRFCDTPFCIRVEQGGFRSANFCANGDTRLAQPIRAEDRALGVGRIHVRELTVFKFQNNAAILPTKDAVIFLTE